MNSGGTAKVIMSSSDVAEESETTVEIKIKTMDSQTHTLRVNRCVPVSALKEQIATLTGVLSEQQRLICRGKVLKDDQLLSAYHVEDGHTLHLVIRPPPNSSVPSTSSEGTTSHQATSGSGSAHLGHRARSFILETVNVEGDIDQAALRRFISSLLDNTETPSSGTDVTTDELRESHAETLAALQQMGAERPSRTFDASLSSSQPQLNHATPRAEIDRRQADNQPPSTGPFRPLNPTVIPDSLTTLIEYIDLLRNEFRREGFGSDGREHSNNAEASGIRRNGGHTQGGLPSPASLAEILQFARQILVEQTQECLSQLARQLDDHASITAPGTRTNMQSNTFRYGVLMQNLGSMLLELGRTTMTLRMGQTPSEAVVNAGPANFISASGPNPLMVQPIPFYPGPIIGGTQTRTTTSSQGEQPDAAVPRNVEIRIRTVSRAVPAATVNAGDQSGAQHPQQQAEMARNYGANVAHQAFPGISAGDSGVRVMPMRTVVAMPPGVAPSPSDSSGNPVHLLYPLLARIRPQSTGHANDARGPQPSGPHQIGPELRISSAQGENSETNRGTARDGNSFPVNTVPPVPGLSPAANESTGRSSQGSLSHQQRPPNNDSGSGSQATNGTNGDTESREAARVGNEQGQILANMLRRIMPLISEGRQSDVSQTNPTSSATQTERGNSIGSSTSRHPHYPPEPPNPKRRKSEDK